MIRLSESEVVKYQLWLVLDFLVQISLLWLFRSLRPWPFKQFLFRCHLALNTGIACSFTLSPRADGTRPLYLQFSIQGLLQS